MASASRSVTITFGESGVARDVILTVKDWCTDEIVTGAAVTLGVYGSQISDANGQVTFANVQPGTHALTVTATGYLPSGSDTLANDSVTV